MDHRAQLGFSRRQFLVTTAAAGTVLALSPLALAKPLPLLSPEGYWNGLVREWPWLNPGHGWSVSWDILGPVNTQLCVSMRLRKLGDEWGPDQEELVRARHMAADILDRQMRGYGWTVQDLRFLPGIRPSHSDCAKSDQLTYYAAAMGHRAMVWERRVFVPRRLRC